MKMEASSKTKLIKLVLIFLSVAIFLSLVFLDEMNNGKAPTHFTPLAIVSSYKVYNSNGTKTVLTPSEQHPLIFFATWCPHCKKDLANKVNPNAYYVDVFTNETSPTASFAAIKTFVKQNHADPDINRYFVSVAKNPVGVPYVPYKID